MVQRVVRVVATLCCLRVGAAAAAIVVLIAGVIVSTLFGLREAEQRREAVRAQRSLEEVVAYDVRAPAGDSRVVAGGPDPSEEAPSDALSAGAEGLDAHRMAVRARLDSAGEA